MLQSPNVVAPEGANIAAIVQKCPKTSSLKESSGEILQTKKPDRTTTIPDTNAEAALEATLLAELLEISNKHASSRFGNTTKKYVTASNDATEVGCSTNGGDVEERNEIHKSAKSFLECTPEDSQFNQYWYSKPTIQCLCEAIVEVAAGKKIAFLSTPSLYFALPVTERKNCSLFEFDKNWAKDPGFEFFNFEDCEAINPALQHSFDMVVVDPPFITRDVWEKYAFATKKLLKATSIGGNDEVGSVLATTVAENIPIMNELFQARPNVFKPNIPNLVYQYNVYTNFDCKALSKVNPEIKLE